MTTRPSVGRPPPQRSLSSTGVVQRPPPLRTHSQQFSSSSPTRRGSDAFVDWTSEGEARHGPRIGASRLRLEISTDSKQTDAVESPKLSSAATPTWRPLVPPRGRPQLHFDVPCISHSHPAPGQHGGAIKPMPLPARPAQHAPPMSQKPKPSPTSTAKKDARPKPYTLEVPAAAPRYPPNGHADFYPWTGNHPEDQFSELAIRSGYYDKGSMTQNEIGSGRAAIFPALKHKSGLQTLSSIFTNVLAQRRAHGQITSASTFKPPPRVTVTDTKRELWLKDLANTTIPLRRLSRSIPHGIRGKVLLDQSLSKNIPIERAVWLAKCVGANELRAFRRKGGSGTFAMGGEAKWIRDFTVCVEQFVDTHFHAEQLLDREHFMDWLVASLENSPQTRLPMWLLITQVYWDDLSKYRRFGRRLAAALMIQLAETLNNPDRDLLAPLSDRLKFLLKGLICSNTHNFLTPKMWKTYRGIFMSNEGLGEPSLSAVLAAIDRRNNRFIATGAMKEQGPRRRLINLLDACLFEPFSNELPRLCWEIDSDKDLLLLTVLQWATSSHRPGSTKIYATVRILRSWSRLGTDVTGLILDFLDTTSRDSVCSKPALYHVVSELARSEHFSTPRYIKWLIARGGISTEADLAPDGPASTRLLAELPTHNVSDSIIELRTALLCRVGLSTKDEDGLVQDCMAHMNNSLPGMQASADFKLEGKGNFGSTGTSELPSGLSRTIRSELGLWLRQKVRLQMVQPTIPPLDEWDRSPMKGGTSALTALDFSTIRRYLEHLGDYSMLADVLKLVTSSSDAEVLASCADTLDAYIEVFAAIGALNDLFEILAGRLRTLTEETGLVPRTFLVSLSDLASRLPKHKVASQQLTQELARNDRKTAADAWSPVSDHMAIVETAEADFTDEIEKVLASGNSMDRATLERLFSRITLRLRASWEKPPEQQRSCALLLTRLRTFDAKQFDLLMVAWVGQFLQMQSRLSMMQVLGPLISFGCLAFRDVALGCRCSETEASPGSSYAPGTALELLCLLMAPCNLPGIMTPEEAYRLRIKQVHMQKYNHVDVLPVIRQAFAESFSNTYADSPRAFEARALLASREMYEFYQRVVLLDPVVFAQKLAFPLLQSSNRETVAAIDTSIDNLLLAGNMVEPITTELLLNRADDLSLPFCQVKLASILQTRDAVTDGDEASQSEHLAAFDSAIESAVNAGKTSWASIIPLLDISIGQHLRRRAATQFLGMFPSPKTSSMEASVMNIRVKRAENLLLIIDATAHSISDDAADPSNITLASDLVSTLNGTWLLLANTPSQEIRDTITSTWLPLLLSFVTTHVLVFEATKQGHENRAKATLTLVAIYLQLKALDISTPAIHSLLEQSFDLALHLVDALPEDIRLQCVRSLRDTTSNPEIAYLFSVASNSTESLFLSQKEKGPVIPGTSAAEARLAEKERLTPFVLRRWEILGEPTPNVGENDTSLSLTLFGARRG
ncbi:transcription mediator subunit Med12 [Diplocarpon rosae]|nr:transcription mediator subunit Med12 [Diplocarpon rosae]